MNLTEKLKNNIAKTQSSELTTWIEFKEDVEFNIRFIPKAAFRSMVDSCTVFKYDPKTKTREPSQDSKKLLDLFINKAIVGWRGVTPRSLAKIAAFPVEGITEEEMDAEVEYDSTLLAALMDSVYELDSFIQETALEVKYFRTGMDDELKNSSSSQSGS